MARGVVTLGLLAIAVAALGACGASSSAAGAPVAVSVPAEALDCRSVHAPFEPDLVGWDAWSRRQLSTLPSRGVVAVRYTAHDCDVELEVLGDCIGRGHYDYVPYRLDATESKIAHSRTKLYAQLPIGAPRLERTLEGGRVLRADLTLVGARTFASHEGYFRDDLVGTDCGRATHVVARIDEGGFVMNVSGGSAAKSDVIDRAGDAGACDRARASRQEQTDCAVPLRVNLLPIAVRPAALACNENDPTPNAMPAAPPPAAFTRIDAKIRQMQSLPSKYVYVGSVEDVLGDGKSKKGALSRDVEEAMALAAHVEKEVVEKDESPEWSVVALTREAEMFERLRESFADLDVHQGLGPAPPGKIALFTPQQTQLLAAVQSRPGAVTTQLQTAALEYWEAMRQQALDDVDRQLLRSYARAAMAVQTKNPAAIRAVRRLARYTRVLGNPKMAKLLGARYVPDSYIRACADLDRSAP